MQFTKVDTTAFETIQLNAGIMVKGADSFDYANGKLAQNASIIAATTGGFSIATNPSYQDFGDDIDNCPPNTYQLKRVLYYDPVVSGTFVSITKDLAEVLAGAADTAPSGISPKTKLAASDFNDIWVIGDYTDKNTSDDGNIAGYIAIRFRNAFNSIGFQWQTVKNGKGQFKFEFHGHYDLTAIDTIPFGIYMREGGAKPANNNSQS